MDRKVCHITSAHNRYDVRIFIKQCGSLAANGYDVTFLVNDDKPDENIDGVKIISTGFKPQNRLARFLGSSKRLREKAFEADADIYQIHDPDLLTLGNTLKRRKKKVIFDSHEDIPQQIRDKSWIPAIIRNIVSKIYGYYERKSIIRYDAVISVTPHIVKRLGLINKNAVMVTNYPVIDTGNQTVRAPENAICFAGGVSSQWSHRQIIEAIKHIDDIRYILAGNGPRGYMDSLRSLQGWSKVEYKGKVPFSEVKDIYSKCIAGMALNSCSQIEGQGTLGNTKLFEFMEAGLPVICTGYPIWKEIVDSYECGICVDPNNIDDIKNAILFIIKNPQEARIMGENGRRAVLEKYNWRTQEKVLLDLYRKL